MLFLFYPLSKAWFPSSLNPYRDDILSFFKPIKCTYAESKRISGLTQQRLIADGFYIFETFSEIESHLGPDRFLSSI